MDKLKILIGNLNSDVNVEGWIYFFIFLHVFFWTLVPAVIRYNLPLDAMEGTTWGHQLEWGYDKNPFLNGWLTALAIYLGGYSGWVTYLFSQVSVALCFLTTWQLAKNMLSPVYALMSVMLLEGVQYYHLHSIDFNDNTLEVGLWALTIFCFYKACHTPSKLLPWLGTGLFAGLAMMAKYYTVILLLPILVFLFFYPSNRKFLKSKYPYIALIIFLLTITPHLIWLCKHEFITILYAFERLEIPTRHSITNHFSFPLEFAFAQIETFLPALILLSLPILNSPFFAEKKITLNTFNKQFLYYIGLGPFLLTLLLSLISGIKLRDGWGAPLLTLWGIIILAIIQPYLTPKKIYTFIMLTFVLMGSLLAVYCFSIVYPRKPTTANFPGTEIAQTLTKLWHDTYHTHLAYIAGSRWIGGNIALYSEDHPAVFLEWNRSRAPWINLKDMQTQGAIFIWDISGHESLPLNIFERFPRLQAPFIIEFPWKRNGKKFPTIKIGVLLLPPSKIRFS